MASPLRLDVTQTFVAASLVLLAGRLLEDLRLRRQPQLHLPREDLTHQRQREEVRVEQRQHARLAHLAQLVAAHLVQLVLVDHHEAAIDEGLRGAVQRDGGRLSTRRLRQTERMFIFLKQIGRASCRERV